MLLMYTEKLSLFFSSVSLGYTAQIYQKSFMICVIPSFVAQHFSYAFSQYETGPCKVNSLVLRGTFAILRPSPLANGPRSI